MSFGCWSNSHDGICEHFFSSRGARPFDVGHSDGGGHRLRGDLLYPGRPDCLHALYMQTKGTTESRTTNPSTTNVSK